MLEITKHLSKNISNFDSVEERLSSIKDQYKDKTAVVLLTGPTLNDHKDIKKTLSNRDDLIIVPIKQAYEITEEISDFHITNPWNIDRTKSYDYKDTITFWGLSQSFLQAHLDIISDNNHKCDIWVPIINPPSITDNDTIQATCNFDLFWMLQNETKSIWGKSILYSSIIPFLLHIGCKDIITIGWDTKINKEKAHFFKDDNFKMQPGDYDFELEWVKSTYKLYDWCKENNVNIKIISDLNPCDERFERLKSIKDI